MYLYFYRQEWAGRGNRSRTTQIKGEAAGKSASPLGRFELIIFGKVCDKLPGQWFQFAQAKVHNHTFDAIDDIGHDIRRIGDVIARANAAAGTKVRHHAGKPFRPVARAKALAFFGNPVDD